MNTLLIVGAGASAEAGLPTGKKLKTDIASKLDICFEFFERNRGDPYIVEALTRHAHMVDEGRSINEYFQAAAQIRAAMPLASSIDAYIHDHQGDKKIEICGKLAIIRTILEAEKNSLLYLDPRDPSPEFDFTRFEATWFNKFWKILTGPRNSIIEQISNVKLIIFNYDRCIEHFLYHALQTYYGISDGEAADHVNELEIYHPYGTVGCLRWQKKGYPVSFGVQQSGSDLLALAPQIRTFAERVEEESVLKEMRYLVQTADKIVFLGFAFHQQNLDLIKPPMSTTAKDVFFTTTGISNSDCELIKEKIYDLLGNVNISVWFRPERTCKGLFDEYWHRLELS